VTRFALFVAAVAGVVSAGPSRADVEVAPPPREVRADGSRDPASEAAQGPKENPAEVVAGMLVDAASAGGDVVLTGGSTPKLAYEIDLHSGLALDSLPDRYAERLSASVGVAYPRGDYLEDVDGGFYCTCYLRAWAFEAQLRDHLRTEFGSDWFRRRAAGDLLRELWSLGQSQRADDLLRELTGEPIRFEVLADEARAVLG